MPWPAALMRFCLFSILAGLAPAGAAEPAAADPRQTWQMLDYIAVDYVGAVQAGRIADARRIMPISPELRPYLENT